MITQAHQSRITPARRKLAEWIYDLGYGYIDNIAVRACQPDLSTATKVRQVKVGKRNKPAAAAVLDSLMKKERFEDLWDILDGICNGQIIRLEVQDNLPFRVNVLEATP